MSTLQHKFDSPVFKEQWEQVKGKLNGLFAIFNQLSNISWSKFSKTYASFFVPHYYYY